MEKDRKDKRSWWMKPLCAGLLFIACACVSLPGTYARYAAAYRASSDITLTVKPGTYAVVLHPGEGAADDALTYEFTYKLGEQVTIPKVGDFFTRTGYTGKGWTTGSDGTGESFKEGGAAVNLTGGGKTLHLYPVWSANSYRVAYDANEGVGAPAEEMAYYGTVHTLSTKAPTRKDYIFTGWFSQKEAGEKLESIEVTGDITVFAHWKPDTAKITYMPNCVPRGYTQVEWIRGDGASYIDTNLLLNSDYQMRVVYEAVDASAGDTDTAGSDTTGSGTVGGDTAGSGTAGDGTDTSSSTEAAASGQSAGIIGTGGYKAYYAALEDGKLLLGWDWAMTASESSETGNGVMYVTSPQLLSSGTGASGKHELYANRHVWRVDGEEVAAFAYEEFKASDTALVFGATGISGYFNGRIYGAQFMDRSGMVSSLIPAVSGTGEPGLYDAKRGSFYSNAGTGEFAVGPEYAGKSWTVPNDSVIQAEGTLFENVGYGMLRWDTKPDGTGTGYQVGDDIAIQEDLTLYAIWGEKIPTLKEGGSWYDQAKGGNASAYSEIRIVDSIGEQTAAQADAVWYADEGDEGLISCYKVGTTLWIAGNGSGSIRMAADSEGMFSSFSGVTRITGLDLLDSGSCESLAWMFTSPQSRAFGNGSDVSGAADNPFSLDTGSTQIVGATSLTSLRGMEAWDVSRVKNMEGLCCGLSELETVNLDKWDTGAVTTLRGAFYDCAKLKSLNICSWDTEAVTDLSYAFAGMGCEAGETSALDLTGWCADKAADVTAMFLNCSKIGSIYVSDVWKTASAAADEAMFSGCGELVGGAGTAYSADHVDSGYARIDSADTPGYLTLAMVKAIAVGDTLVFTYGGGGYEAGDLYIASAVDAVYDVPVNAQAETSLGWITAESDAKRIKVEKNFGRFKPSSMMYWFSGLKNLVMFDGLGYMDTSEVTSMKRTFYYAGSKASSFDIDLSSWDVSKVTDFSETFSYTGQKASKWSVGNLGGWNVSSAVNMSKMFCFAGYSGFSWYVGDIGRWDVSHVTTFAWTFYSVAVWAKCWKLDLSDWNPASATNMSYMFAHAGSGASEWSLGNLGKWNVSNVTNLTSTFSNTGSKAKVWSLGDINDWDTSNVTEMMNTFYASGLNAEKFELDISDWDTSHVRSMSSMFQAAGGCAKEIDFGGVSDWDVSSTTNMGSMFRAFATKIPDYVLDLRNWNTSKVGNMANMFENMTSLKTIYVGDGWNTDSVTAKTSTSSSKNTFNNCTSLVGGNGTVYDADHVSVEYARIDTAETPGYLTAAPTEQVLSLQAAAASLQLDAGSGDVQQKYIETLLMYEGSLYDPASGAFTPGASPVTGTYYATKEDWLSSGEYSSWDAECGYLKSLIEL